MKSTLNSSKFIECFNQQNSRHGIYYCETFTESKFHIGFGNTVKPKT